MNGISSIKVLHNQSTLNSNKLVIFHDSATRRDAICKKKLMAFILCNIFFDNIFAVVNELSRFGSDPVFVTFILEILKYRGKRVIIAAQLDFDPDEIISAEYDRKISQAMYEGKRIADEEELIYSIPDENLSRQQQSVAKIGRYNPRRKDYEELIEVMGVPFEQRKMYLDKELAVFKPKPLSGNNFTNMQVRRNVQPTRVIPASTYQTEVNLIPTDEQHIQQNKNSQPAKVIPTRNVKQPHVKSPACTIKFVAETSKFGLLIGGNFRNIKEIEKKASCKIRIYGESSKYDGWSSATITGNDDQRDGAKQMLNALARERGIGMFFVP